MIFSCITTMVPLEIHGVVNLGNHRSFQLFVIVIVPIIVAVFKGREKGIVVCEILSLIAHLLARLLLLVLLMHGICLSVV